MPPRLTLQVAGASTDVGKTILSTALALSLAASETLVRYIKPISTGPLDENDGRHLETFAGRLGLADKIQCTTVVQLDDASSPHLARRRQGGGSGTVVLGDEQVLDRVRRLIEGARATTTTTAAASGATLVEQAGGVHSPVLSGASQADFYRPLRLPTLLVGDAKLGGISATIAAYEALRMRGYTVDALTVFKETRYENWKYLRDWVERENERTDVDLAFCALDAPPPRRQERERDGKVMGDYYRALLPAMTDLVAALRGLEQGRLDRLERMPKDTLDTVWYPFTQHKLLAPKDITVIDSASGDYLTTYARGQLERTFDGPASWWTQGLGHGNPELAMTAAHAAGRYGHVILPNATNEPVLDLTQRLLASTLAQGWAERVFYSDNGSTAMEVAIKMAIRTACERHRWRGEADMDRPQEVGIIGLQGAYHGDTIGAMDASEANVYNEAVDWYKGRGAWFDPPYVMIRRGEAAIRLNDQWIPKGSLGYVYDIAHRLEHDPMARFYEERINRTLDQLEDAGQYFGALILEPVVMGAGGMIFVDPLFQRVLVQVVRSRVPRNSRTSSSGIPVIFDEVFAGLYRLGRARAGSFLGPEIFPDIACYAKLLTGGLTPLGVTLTSSEIFKTFYKDTKAQALLHGHSYTGYPIGCAVANQSLKTLDKLDKDGAWRDFQREWQAPPSSSSSSPTSSNAPPTVWSVFSPHFTAACSSHPAVEGVMTLGSVFAITLKTHAQDDTGGYASTVSSKVVERLRKGTEETMGIMMRPLGNVIYVMTGQRTTRASVAELERALQVALDG